MKAISLWQSEWTIRSWECRFGGGGCAFSIWVSPKFLVAAKELGLTVDKDRFLKSAEYICKEAGFESSFPVARLQWGEYGLMHIEVPGEASGLDYDYTYNHEVERCGAKYSPHNVDSHRQQSALMAIWLYWAQGVEAHDRS